MHTNTYFTNCDICQKSIHTDEQHLTLNFHKETGSKENGQKTVTVQFAMTSMTTCLQCGRHLAEFVLSDALIDEVNFRRLSQSSSTPDSEYKRKEELVETEEIAQKSEI